MGRRTISNLSRELKISRPTIYKKIKELGIKKKAEEEYSEKEYELLKKHLFIISNSNKKIKEEIKQLDRPTILPEDAEEKYLTNLLDENDNQKNTLNLRLQNAKQEYNYNRELIVKFQTEADNYYKTTGKTTALTHNGTLAAIPAITNLDKYIKLNIGLSKLISDLESDLDLEGDPGDDPFG